MLTPIHFMNLYRNLKVKAGIDDLVARQCREFYHEVRLSKYFMMSWEAGTKQMSAYNAVTAGGKPNDTWFRANNDGIRTAAMGKGSPRDYELALEWALRSGKIKERTRAGIQAYCDTHLGIDCSGFVTNYLIANGRKDDTDSVKRNTGAASYYNTAKAVNDPTAIRQGDLLVWMNGNQVKTSPAGHIAVVESYMAQCRVGGNMRVVEATGDDRAKPKLLDSMYAVEKIINKGEGGAPVMILAVRRHGVSGARVAVIRL